MYNQALSLLNILIGSGRSASRSSGTLASKTKSIINKIQVDIRNTIDANLPAFYLVNSEVIVDTMLDYLHPNKGSSLSKYLVSMKLLDGITQVEFTDIDPKVTETKNAFGKVLSSTSTGGFISEYTNQYNILLSKRADIQRVVIRHLKSSLSNKQSMVTVSNTLAKLDASLAKKIAILSSLPEGSEQKIIQEGNKHTRAVGALIRRVFKGQGVSVITDADAFINGYNPQTQLLLVAANYSIVTETPHRLITEVLEKYVKKLKITVYSNDTGFKAGNFAQAGHTGLRAGSSIIGINTPLSQITSIILNNNNIDAPGIMEGFIINTGHLDWSLDIKENYSSAGSMLLRLGVSFLQSMPAVYNSETLSGEETAFFKKYLKSAFDLNYLELRKQLNKSIKDPKFFNFILKTLQMSPSLEKVITNYVVEPIKGIKYVGPKGSTNGSILGKDQLLKLTGSKANIKKISGNKTKPSNITKLTTSFRTVNLVSLQNLINANLQNVISANMGDGSSRNILNYRTGRLAASAAVESISESRAGMITAFYTYMKNPYQTFEPGYRQGNPASRDPKLLISKSIREIAATKVGNRLRAISV